MQSVHIISMLYIYEHVVCQACTVRQLRFVFREKLVSCPNLTNLLMLFLSVITVCQTT